MAGKRQPAKLPPRRRGAEWPPVSEMVTGPIKRPAVMLKGGKRHGWCYYADELDAQVQAEREQGRAFPYVPTAEVITHPTAKPVVTVSVWSARE